MVCRRERGLYDLDYEFVVKSISLWRQTNLGSDCYIRREMAPLVYLTTLGFSRRDAFIHLNILMSEGALEKLGLQSAGFYKSILIFIVLIVTIYLTHRHVLFNGGLKPD